jgi:hypothetical protein
MPRCVEVDVMIVSQDPGQGNLLRDIDRRSQVVVRNEAESGCATKGK